MYSKTLPTATSKGGGTSESWAARGGARVLFMCTAHMPQHRRGNPGFAGPAGSAPTGSPVNPASPSGKAFGCCSARQNVPLLILHGLPWVWGEMLSLAVCKCRHPTLACASLVASRLSHGSHTTALISYPPPCLLLFLCSCLRHSTLTALRTL